MAAEGAVLINLGKLPRSGVPAPPGPELSAGGRRSARAPALKTCSTSRGGDPEDLSGASSERRLRATTPPLLSPLPYDSRHCRRGRQPRASWSRAPTRGAEGWRRNPAAEGAPEAGTPRTTARPNSRGNVGLLGLRGQGAGTGRTPPPRSRFPESLSRFLSLPRPGLHGLPRTLRAGVGVVCRRPSPGGRPLPTPPATRRVVGVGPLTGPRGRAALGPGRPSRAHRPSWEPSSRAQPCGSTTCHTEGAGRCEMRATVKFKSKTPLDPQRLAKLGYRLGSPVRGFPHALQESKLTLAIPCSRAKEGHGGATGAGVSYVLSDPSLGSWREDGAMGQRRGDRSGSPSRVGKE